MESIFSYFTGFFMGSLWPQAWHEAPSLLLVESVHRLDDKMMNLKKFTDASQA